MRRPVWALGAIAAALLFAPLAGCDIGRQDGVTRIDEEEIENLAPLEVDTEAKPSDSQPSVSAPASGSDPAQTPGSDAPVTTVARRPVTLFFIEADGLLPVEVGVEIGGERRVLDRLQEPPPSRLADQGVRTALPSGLVNGVELAMNGMSVDLDGKAFARVSNQDQQLLFGQIVLTLTNLPGRYRSIANVRFTIDGTPQSVPLRDNTPSAPGAYVTARDYEQLLRPDGTTTVPGTLEDQAP